MADKILVLDDEGHYAEMLQAVLEQHYFVTDVEHDPADALRALERNGYQLIISDYRMPTMDGSDFLVKARAIDPDLPIVLVSGLMNTPELLKVANLGATLVFEKPVHVEPFIEAVRRFVQPLSASDFYRFRRGKGGSSGATTGLPVPSEEARKAVAGAAEAGPVAMFPRPLAYLAADSWPMVAFLNDLWQAIAEQTHVFVQTPPGSEIELILREVSRWQHKGERSLRFLMAHRVPAGTPDWLTALPESETFSHTVGVLGYQLADTTQQARLVDCIREAPEAVTFVHFVNSNLLELSSNRIHPELQELIREHLAVLPPLNRRLSDLVGYTQHYLPVLGRKEGKGGQCSLAPEAFSTLLSYPWPLNFAELLEVLRRSVLLARSEEITEAVLTAALRQSILPTETAASLPGGVGVRLERHALASTAAPSLKLDRWLLERQRNLIRARLPALGNDLAEVLRAAGAPAEILQTNPTLDQLPLLFPELLPKAG